MFSMLSLWSEKKKYGSLIDEAAEQLRGIRTIQSEIIPPREYATYLVGDKVELESYEQEILIRSGSPIDIWMKLHKL